MNLSKVLVLVTMGTGVLFGAGSVGSAAEPVESQGKTAVLVELFTSEGCSSCPPADRLLSRLVAEQPIDGVEIVGLGEHVDYWNYLGWEDPFSSSEFTLRQQSYARAFQSARIYTPQMVVDGRDEFVGNDRSKALSAIRESLSEKRVRVSLAISPETPSRLAIRISELEPFKSGKSKVLLAITEENLHSQVPRGENRGLRLDHSSVLRKLIQVGEIEPGHEGSFSTVAELKLSPEWKSGDVKVVVFVQRADDLRVLGAASIQPPPRRTMAGGSR